MAAVKRHADRRGMALVETALVLMLLLLLTFAAIEYGWMFIMSGYVVNAARHGVRLGVRPDATTAEVQAAVGSLMTSAGMDGSGYAVSISPGDVSALSPGQPLSVTVSVPYENVELTGFPLLPMPANLRAKAVMAKEGPGTGSDGEDDDD